jgi:hypothetical protein
VEGAALVGLVATQIDKKIEVMHKYDRGMISHQIEFPKFDVHAKE